MKYGFKHINSSPYHHKGNRRAEAAVKVAEPMLKRADDFHSALRLFRDTPNLGAHTLTYDKSLSAEHKQSKLAVTNMPNHHPVIPVNPASVGKW